MLRRVMMMALAAAFAASVAEATSALDRAYGTPLLGRSPRAIAMGGAGSVLPQGPFSLVDNPAALARLQGAAAALAVSTARVGENRFVPLFDTFDSYVHETAIAVNDHVYADFRGGLAWTAPSLHGVVLAGGVWDRYDPRYDYFDERRTTQTTDQIVAERWISTTGTLRALSLGAAVPFGDVLALGAAVHRYDGRIRHRDALVPRAAGVSGRVLVERRALSGMSGSLGVTAKLGPRLRGGVAWESGPRLEDRYDVSVDDVLQTAGDARRDVWLPPRVTLGATYLPRNALRTTFALDAVWTPWSSITDPDRPDARLLDTWDVRFGLEHVYYQNLPGRIGFRYERSSELREADRVWLTFGAGWSMAGGTLDAGVEVGKRESRQDPVWPRAEQGTAVGAGRDRIEDTVARLTLGAEWRF